VVVVRSPRATDHFAQSAFDNNIIPFNDASLLAYFLCSPTPDGSDAAASLRHWEQSRWLDCLFHDAFIHYFIAGSSRVPQWRSNRRYSASAPR